MNGAAFGTGLSRRNFGRFKAILGDLSKTDSKNIATLGDLKVKNDHCSKSMKNP